MAKTIQTVAYEVLAGKWGSGEERKQKLTKAGYDYDKVQAYVNQILAMNEKVLEACEVQANWMKNYTYNWSKWKPRTVARSKNYGTCVTYASCVLQRLGYLKSGEYLWHNGKGYGTGKVYIWGKNGKKTITSSDYMTITYMGNKTFASLRGQLRPGDVVMVDDNKSGKSGSGGHIMVFSGKWSTKGNPMIWDNTSGTRMKNGKKGRHAYGKNRKVLAIVRVEPIIKQTTKKTNKEIAKEVIDGKWGSGDERKQKLIKAGYDYDAIQKLVNEIVESPSVVDKMNAWAVETAKEKYHYVRWKAGDMKTHTCPICNKRKYDDHFGWNCIGWAFAIWHHGGGLKTKCSCHVVADAAKILNAKTDKAAYDEAVKRIGIKNIEVIRNGGKSIKNKLKAGDICWTMSDGKIQHTYYYMGNGKYSDSTSGRSDNIKANITASDSLLNKTVLAVRYVDKAPTFTATATTKKPYSGTLPSMRLVKTNAQVIADTIRWAKWIAGDNRFHYGYTSSDKKINAHHNGCYFCGTNTTSGGRSKKGIVDYQFTYCCNPFVGAAWAHGGCVPKALSLCQKGSSWDFNKGHGYDSSSLFTNLGHPAKSKLRPGDVLCRDTHVALYIGDGKIAEAGAEDDNKRNSEKWNNSIRVKTLTDANYKNFLRVHRFNSSVNAEMYVYHGEVSMRVSQWQTFLDWWYNGKVGNADGIYGDNTLKWTKKFQEEQLGKGQGDGIIGPKTLEAAKKCKK